MSELQKHLSQLLLRLDCMGLRVEQAVARALRAAETLDEEAAAQLQADDALIDQEEVAIEQECIRQLALFQPTAIDLRKICFVIKVNNDLERIADLAASIGRRVAYLRSEGLFLRDYPGYLDLAQDVSGVLHRTVQLLSTLDADAARTLLADHLHTHQLYRDFVRGVLDRERLQPGGVDTALTLNLLARTLERIGALCANIAEDTVFLRTGEIVRHSRLPAEAVGSTRQS